VGITKDQVWAAADELHCLGKSPTLVAVRDALGETGSFSTIAPAMAEWRTLQAKTPIPEAFSARMRQQAEHVWAEALSVADELVSSERDALRAARKELETERAEMASLLDHAAGQIAAATLRHRDLEAKLEELSDLNAAINADLAGARARLDEREQAVRMERLERQSAQAALAEARERLAAIEAAHGDLCGTRQESGRKG
jgi:hypothetical protein